MKRLVILTLCLFLCGTVAWGASPNGAAAEAEKPTLIVLPLEPLSVSSEVAASLDDLLVGELERAQLFTVVAQEDLRVLLSQVELKQLLGEDDEAELAAVGERLKAQYLLRSSLGRVGNTYLLSLNMIDVKQAKAVRRINQTLAGSADDLIGSLHSAVVALALEEKGYAPDLTAELVENYTIARKEKTLFLRANIGYEIPVGPYNHSSSLLYALPDLMTFNVDAGVHVLPWLQVIAETGVGFSILETYQNQIRTVSTRYSSASAASPLGDEINVITQDLDYSSLRVPLQVLARFQPPKGRLLPFVQLGLGFSWQRVHFGDETLNLVENARSGLTDGVCPDGWTEKSGACFRETEDTFTLMPESETVDYFNIQLPLAAGFDYLITQHFGFGVEARYTLAYALNLSEELNDFASESVATTRHGDEQWEVFEDRVPIRRLHHGIGVMVGLFYYY